MQQRKGAIKTIHSVRHSKYAETQENENKRLNDTSPGTTSVTPYTYISGRTTANITQETFLLYAPQQQGIYSRSVILRKETLKQAQHAFPVHTPSTGGGRLKSSRLFLYGQEKNNAQSIVDSIQIFRAHSRIQRNLPCFAATASPLHACWTRQLHRGLAARLPSRMP
jgi:hypothetical protein